MIVVKHVRGTNASIHVQEHVVKMLVVKWLIIFLPVHVMKAMLETLLPDAHLKSMIQLYNKTHVFLHLVVQIHNAEMLMVILYVHVLQDILDHHQTANQNVLSVQNVLMNELVSIKDVLILALELAEIMRVVKSSIIALFAVVHQDKLVIHSKDVSKL